MSKVKNDSLVTRVVYIAYDDKNELSHDLLMCKCNNVLTKLCISISMGLTNTCCKQAVLLNVTGNCL